MSPGARPPGSAPDPDRASGGLQPTPPRTLLAWGAVGVLGGVLVKPACRALDVVPPLVTAPQPLALFLLAALLGYVAWATWRVLHVRHERLPSHQAVNRLVLARASALVAALATGGYLGYALSWIGDRAEQADDRMVGSFVAAGAALLAVVAAVLLERACRVSDDDGEPGADDAGAETSPSR